MYAVLSQKVPKRNSKRGWVWCIKNWPEISCCVLDHLGHLFYFFTQNFSSLKIIAQEKKIFQLNYKCRRKRDLKVRYVWLYFGYTPTLCGHENSPKPVMFFSVPPSSGISPCVRTDWAVMPLTLGAALLCSSRTGSGLWLLSRNSKVHRDWGRTLGM